MPRNGGRNRCGDARPDVLDVGCGRSRLLVRYRRRIGRLVGLDSQAPPAGPPSHLDAFVEADVCRRPDAFPPGSFDVVLSKFAVEHLHDPATAFAAIRAWLRPGGTLVLVTVNRGHPLVAAYLDLPPRLRSRLQRLVKLSAEDAHPLVGACNDPRALRLALAASGFETIQTRSVGNLARAWGRWWPGYLLAWLGTSLPSDPRHAGRPWSSAPACPRNAPEPRAARPPEVGPSDPSGSPWSSAVLDQGSLDAAGPRLRQEARS